MKKKNRRSFVGTISITRFNSSVITKLIPPLLFSIGVIALAFSINYSSSVFAFIGLGLVFWGAILFYIRPEKYVKQAFLEMATLPLLANIEKILGEFCCKSKGIYLPPKYLKDFESSIVFVPSKTEYTLATLEEVGEEKLFSRNPIGIFLTPPGLALSKLFEQKLGTSFTKTDLKYIQEHLPKLLDKDMEIGENIEINTDNKKVVMEITNSVFNEICQETRKFHNTYEAMGCLLSSAIACALAKATGRPIRIETEEQSQDQKLTRLQFQIVDD